AGPALSLRRRHAPAPGVSPARRRVLSYFKALQDRCSDGMGEPVRRGMGERRLSGQVARLTPKAALGAPYLNCPNAPSQPVFDIESRLYGPTGTPARAVRHHPAATLSCPRFPPVIDGYSYKTAVFCGLPERSKSAVIAHSGAEFRFWTNKKPRKLQFSGL